MGSTGSSEIERVRRLLSEGREIVWYNCAPWQRLREQVLQMDHCECQRCKARGRYARATIVHHVKHLRDRPDLALSIYDPDTGERQLLSVCKSCHEELHPEWLRQYKITAIPVTEERWD